MKGQFRFTRHGCGPSHDVSVHLLAEQADAFSVVAEPQLALTVAPSNLRAVVLGVHSAYSAAEPLPPLAVTVVAVTDHSGATGDLGFKICGEAAMQHLLGFPEKAPFPRYVLGEA